MIVLVKVLVMVVVVVLGMVVAVELVAADGNVLNEKEVGQSSSREESWGYG